MAIEVTMPQMGESVVEGTVAKWLVREGDQVALDQPIAEISTDKVDAEIPSPGAGVIATIIAHEGETVPVGGKLAIIEPAGSAAPSPPEPAAAPRAAELRPTIAADGATRGKEPEAAAAPRVPAPPAAAEQGGGEPRRYSPVVLRMASEQGVDLQRITGTGIGGRVTKRDLLNYVESLGGGTQTTSPADAASGAPAAFQRIAPPAAPPVERPRATPPGAIFRPPIYEPREGDSVEPFSRRRKLIAEHMVYSKTHSPHVGTVAEVDMTRASALREAHKHSFREREGFALTMLPLAAAATVRALKEFPRMNAAVAADALVIRREINLGVAMDDEEGLLVPVIRSAQAMSVVGLAREIERLRRRIESRQLTAADLAGGSFTLSNPGREGNLYGFAIINQPQVGILRMGEIKRRPVAVESNGSEALAIRSMMYLALSYDHRVVDGVLGNRFLYRVARILEEADFEL
jgi:pyruvate/2-oxoglutarate dehydrogenase complex dihydrolipoamide acyltransferase (E2) component